MMFFRLFFTDSKIFSNNFFSIFENSFFEHGKSILILTLSNYIFYIKSIFL